MVKFFDLGINEEVYWNYFHMALQIEDIFDVLTIKFPGYDFLILMDQSSGHGKKMEGGLNAIEMSVRFGGSKKKYCELAGEGVECAWEFMKRNFCN